jgi:hypothetical protein
VDFGEFQLPELSLGDSGVIIDNDDDQKGFIGLVETKTGAAITAYGDWGGVPGQGVATLKSLAYDSKKGYLYVSGIYERLVNLGEYANGGEVLLNGPASLWSNFMEIPRVAPS